MLTVAAIPVAMPTVLSVTMAVGARLLAKKKAIVTRLVGYRGTRRRRHIVLGQDRHTDPKQVDAGRSVQRQRHSRRSGNPRTRAGFARGGQGHHRSGRAGGLKSDQALKSYQVVHFQPFDPVHKRTEATVKGADGKEFKVAKGAPQVILELSANAAR